MAGESTEHGPAGAWSDPTFETEGGWLTRMLTRRIADVDGPGRGVPPIALLLSLLCLAVPVVGAAVSPDVLAGDPALLLWILALVPPFLLSYYRAWQGAAVALAGGMAAVSVAGAAVSLFDAPVPSTGVVVPAVVVLLVVSLGSGILSSLFQEAIRIAREQALIDGLTGLPNRRHALLHLERAVAAAERGRMVSAVLFDVDGLDGVNDREGRAAGDRVLETVAAVLRDRTRTMNLCARFGGDEFLAVLEGVSGDGAVEFAERVQSDLRERGLPGGATVSIGIARHEAGMGSPDILLAAADQGLYRAKSRGGGRTVLLERRGRGFTPSVHGDGGLDDDAAAAALPGETVLVVDDDPAVLDLLSRVLYRAGYQVLEAAGPDEALAYTGTSHPIDVIVTDIVMPGMSGFSLVEALAGHRPGLRALYISGYGEDEIDWAGVPGESKAFLSKPMRPDAFVAAVGRLARGEPDPGLRRDGPAGHGRIAFPLVLDGDPALTQHVRERLAIPEPDPDAPTRGPRVLVVETLRAEDVDRWSQGADGVPELVIALDFDWEDRVRALEAGVADVLPHDMLDAELAARLRGAARRWRPGSEGVRIPA